MLGALAVAMLPLAHNAVALLMFPAFLAIVAVRSAVSDHRLKTAAAGASVLVGGLGLSAYFWLPAALISALQRPTAISVVLGAFAVAMLPLAHNAVALLMLPVFAAVRRRSRRGFGS